MRKNLLSVAVFVVLIGLFAFAANDWRAPWASPPAHGADWCKAHGVELSKCEKCNVKLARGGTFSTMEREPKDGECPNTLVRITLAPEVSKNVGIEFYTLKAQNISETIKANAETRYPPSKFARVAPRISGVIREVKAILGQEVTAGTPLAVIESSEFGQAKSDYMQAVAVLDLRQQTYDREQGLVEKKITAGREALEAKAQLEEARLILQRAGQRLTLLGVSADQLRDLVDKKEISGLMDVIAPFGGTVVEATAVPGESASPEKPIFSVAGIERFWIAIDVYESDLPKIEKDQRVVFTVEGLPGRRFPGSVVALGGEVDDRTRTVPVYAEIKNVQHLLRSRMFGRAEIVVNPPEAKLLAPRAAVHSDGDCNLAFVSPSKDVYQARKIELGAVYDNGYEIIGGLAAGESIVTTGGFLLKTEVLRGQMGAG